MTLEVVDEGPGIAAEEAERIFDKFYRGRGGDTAGGTGLGLAVCRGFVEAMGGAIEALPRADRRGTVFRADLPGRARRRAGAGAGRCRPRLARPPPCSWSTTRPRSAASSRRRLEAQG